MAKVKWPDNDIIRKCCDVYSLFNNDQNNDHQKEDWMLSFEFLNDEQNVVIVEEQEPLIEYDKSKLLYIGFNGVLLNEDDLSSTTSLVKIALQNYKDKTCFGFQKQATACLSLVRTKLQELEASEDSENGPYDVIFCGYSIGGSIAATAFINLVTRLHLGAKSPNVPIDSIMSLRNENKSETQQNCENLIDQKIQFDSGHMFRCITHGALMFGNKKNQEYCMKKRISKGTFNVIHEKDPLPKIFFQLPSEFYEIQANNAIGNFRILQNNNNKIYVTDISDKESDEIEDFFIKNEILPFDLVYHKLNVYKVPVNQGNTELDAIDRINKDFKSLDKPYISTIIIGKGSFGIVVKATNLINNDTVAIKKLNTKIGAFEQKFEAVDNDECIIDKNIEIENLLKVKNEHVVTLMDYFHFQKQKIYLIFEYCAYGSLRSYIVSEAKVFNDHESRELATQLIDGLSAIHEKKIIHRDVKPDNILVTSLQNGNLCYKISDLGSSLEYQGRGKLLTVVGTELYMSPEIYLAYKNDKLNAKISPKTDIFSLGAVFLFCIKQQNPWSDHDFDTLTKHGFEELVINCSHRSLALKEMLVCMLKVKSHERLSSESLLLHPFIQDDRVKLRNKDSNVMEEKQLHPVKIKEVKRSGSMLEKKEVEKDIAMDYSQLVAQIDKAIGSTITGYYTDSIANCHEALKIATYLKQNDGVELCMESVAKFKEMESLPWILYGSEALDTYISFCYQALGACHLRVGDLKTAIVEFKKSIEITRQLEKNRVNLLDLATKLSELGICYINNLDYKEAFECFRDSLMSIAVSWNIQNTDEFKEIISLAQLDHVKLPLCSSEDGSLPIGHWSEEMSAVLINLANCYLSIGNICFEYHE